MTKTACLPPLYERWFEQLAGSPSPSEPEATCEDCPQCKPNGPFHPRVKCCGHYPELPSFLVGGILATEAVVAPWARSELERRVTRGFATTPSGLAREPGDPCREARARRAFGQDPSLICPYFDPEQGRCGIWTMRNAVCSTWFCKFQRGSTGARFWTDTRDWLLAVERAVCRWCSRELDTSVPWTPADPPSTEPGLGGARAFYEACWRNVETLTWDDVARLGDEELLKRAERLRASFLSLSRPVVPNRLRMGKPTVLSMNDERITVETFDAYNAVTLPRELFDVLHYFDGTESAQARDRITECTRLVLDDELVLKLWDFRLVEDAANPDEPMALRDVAPTEPDAHLDRAFASFSQYELHTRVFADQRRVADHRRAIESIVRPGDHVLDLGTGTGLLAMLAARQGARVTAIESGPVIAMARALARENGVEDRIRFLNSSSFQVDLDDQADVLVTELRAKELLEGHVLEAVTDARARLLLPGSRMIPGRIHLWAQAGDGDFHRTCERLAPIESLHGLSLGALASWTARSRSSGRLSVSPGPAAHSFKPLTQREHLASFDLASLSDASFDRTIHLTVVADGNAEAVALSLTAELIDGETVEMSGDDLVPSWLLVAVPRRCEVRAGDRVELRVRYGAGGAFEVHGFNARVDRSATP